MDYLGLNRRLIFWVRILLGVQYLLGGINWWYKILPFPSISDPSSAAAKHAVLVAMVETGWMFMAAKIVELLMGLSLLFNRFIPVMLVVAFPVALTTFILDAFIFHALIGWLAGTVSGGVLWAKVLDMIFFGGAVLAMHGYLMLAYFDLYRPMLVAKSEPHAP